VGVLKEISSVSANTTLKKFQKNFTKKILKIAPRIIYAITIAA